MSKEEYAKGGTKALSIIGTVLGGAALLGNSGNCGNGILGGLFGGNNQNCEQVQRGQRAETELAIVTSYFMPTWREICDLKSEVAVNRAVDVKNQEITGLLFRMAENRTDAAFALQRAQTEAAIEKATCNVIRGIPYLSPSQLADPYQAGANILFSRHIPAVPENRGCGGCGGGCGNTWNW